MSKTLSVQSPVSAFGFRHSFGFRQSSFGFENCSLFNKKAGQRTGESGRSWVGSWKAPYRICSCIVTMNQSVETPRLESRLQVVRAG